ncbi:MAG: regulatory protein RecX [Candidatus Omnitrophica bacterium]|nr:regulatory protein RecX [Candidatus Omnitrophota bacterium]
MDSEECIADRSDKIKARAKNNAYSLLRQRPRSEFEIRNRLKLKGYGSDVVESVIEGLRRAGEIDDARFAQLWVESQMHLNPVGDVVLRNKLKEKGVSDPIIEAVLAKKAGDYDEYELALNMAREQFARLKKLDRRKALKRVYDFLLRRGFKYDTVRTIVENITDED